MYLIARQGLLGLILLVAISSPAWSASVTQEVGEAGLSATAPLTEVLPTRINGWKLRELKGTPFLAYGRKNRDFKEVFASTTEELLKATGMKPAPGLVFVMEGARDAALLLEALKGSDPSALIPEGMNFGKELSMEMAFSMIPIPLRREAAANLLHIDPSSLAEYDWFMALPSRSGQKRAMKNLIKQQMKKEDINFALRLLIRPFLGKITSMAVEAMQPAAQVMLFQQWLEALHIPEAETATLVASYKSRLEAETKEKTEAMAKDMESKMKSAEHSLGIEAESGVGKKDARHEPR